MPFISLTRLRIRSIRFMPMFALHTWRSLRQIRSASGFQNGELLMDRKWTFWTLTAWSNEAAMRGYMTAGAHKQAMPKLLDWCDEASVAHWTAESAALPSWLEADQRMRQQGRVSKVRHPSPDHASMQYRKPRTTARGPIKPRSR